MEYLHSNLTATGVSLFNPADPTKVQQWMEEHFFRTLGVKALLNTMGSKYQKILIWFFIHLSMILYKWTCLKRFVQIETFESMSSENSI